MFLGHLGSDLWSMVLFTSLSLAWVRSPRLGPLTMRISHISGAVVSFSSSYCWFLVTGEASRQRPPGPKHPDKASFILVTTCNTIWLPRREDKNNG
ncbi:hypothetical protein F4825DRAFT_138709 [Nemania diffusa]|nr:hypothetical protein F4825DRAFT_138709 [Nemania diffusa]